MGSKTPIQRQLLWHEIPHFTMPVLAATGSSLPAVAAVAPALLHLLGAAWVVAGNMFAIPVVLHSTGTPFPHKETAKVKTAMGAWFLAASLFVVPCPTDLTAIRELLQEIHRHLGRHCYTRTPVPFPHRHRCPDHGFFQRGCGPRVVKARASRL